MQWIRSQIGSGAGMPDADAIARKFGWRVSSARDALQGLAADGLLRIAGHEGPHRRAIYEPTAAGCSAASKACRHCRTRKPPAGFYSSRYTVDGLTDICRNCIRLASEAGRSERAARRAAKVAAP
jgi:hypothetical protein